MESRIPLCSANASTLLTSGSRFARAVPLLDLPNVAGPKDMLREAAAIAADLERAVMTWDAVAEPPPALVSLARRFLTSLGLPEGYEFQVPGDPPQG